MDGSGCSFEDSPPPIPPHQVPLSKDRPSTSPPLRPLPSLPGRPPSLEFMQQVGPNLLPHDLPAHMLPTSLPPSPPPPLYVIMEEDEDFKKWGCGSPLGEEEDCTSFMGETQSYDDSVTDVETKKSDETDDVLKCSEPQNIQGVSDGNSSSVNEKDEKEGSGNEDLDRRPADILDDVDTMVIEKIESEDCVDSNECLVNENERVVTVPLENIEGSSCDAEGKIEGSESKFELPSKTINVDGIVIGQFVFEREISENSGILSFSNENTPVFANTVCTESSILEHTDVEANLVSLGTNSPSETEKTNSIHSEISNEMIEKIQERELCSQRKVLTPDLCYPDVENTRTPVNSDTTNTQNLIICLNNDEDGSFVGESRCTAETSLGYNSEAIEFFVHEASAGDLIDLDKDVLLYNDDTDKRNEEYSTDSDLRVFQFPVDYSTKTCQGDGAGKTNDNSALINELFHENSSHDEKSIRNQNELSEAGMTDNVCIIKDSFSNVPALEDNSSTLYGLLPEVVPSDNLVETFDINEINCAINRDVTSCGDTRKNKETKNQNIIFSPEMIEKKHMQEITDSDDQFQNTEELCCHELIKSKEQTVDLSTVEYIFDEGYEGDIFTHAGNIPGSEDKEETFGQTEKKDDDDYTLSSANGNSASRLVFDPKYNLMNLQQDSLTAIDSLESEKENNVACVSDHLNSSTDFKNALPNVNIESEDSLKKSAPYFPNVPCDSYIEEKQNCHEKTSSIHTKTSIKTSFVKPEFAKAFTEEEGSTSLSDESCQINLVSSENFSSVISCNDLPKSETATNEADEVSPLPKSETATNEVSPLPKSETVTNEADEVSPLPKSETATNGADEVSPLPKSETATNEADEVSPLPNSETATNGADEVSPLPKTETATNEADEVSPLPKSEIATNEADEVSLLPKSETATNGADEVSPLPKSETATNEADEVSPLPKSEIATNEADEVSLLPKSETATDEADEMSLLPKSETAANEADEVLPLPKSEAVINEVDTFQSADSSSDAQSLLENICKQKIDAVDRELTVNDYCSGTLDTNLTVASSCSQEFSANLFEKESEDFVKTSSAINEITLVKHDHEIPEDFLPDPARPTSCSVPETRCADAPLNETETKGGSRSQYFAARVISTYDDSTDDVESNILNDSCEVDTSCTTVTAKCLTTDENCNDAVDVKDKEKADYVCEQNICEANNAIYASLIPKIIITDEFDNSIGRTSRMYQQNLGESEKESVDGKSTLIDKSKNGLSILFDGKSENNEESVNKENNDLEKNENSESLSSDIFHEGKNSDMKKLPSLLVNDIANDHLEGPHEKNLRTNSEQSSTSLKDVDENCLSEDYSLFVETSSSDESVTLCEMKESSDASNYKFEKTLFIDGEQEKDQQVLKNSSNRLNYNDVKISVADSGNPKRYSGNMNLFPKKLPLKSFETPIASPTCPQSKLVFSRSNVPSISTGEAGSEKSHKSKWLKSKWINKGKSLYRGIIIPYSSKSSELSRLRGITTEKSSPVSILSINPIFEIESSSETSSVHSSCDTIKGSDITGSHSTSGSSTIDLTSTTSFPSSNSSCASLPQSISQSDTTLNKKRSDMNYKDNLVVAASALESVATVVKSHKDCKNTNCDILSKGCDVTSFGDNANHSDAPHWSGNLQCSVCYFTRNSVRDCPIDLCVCKDIDLAESSDYSVLCDQCGGEKVLFSLESICNSCVKKLGKRSSSVEAGALSFGGKFTRYSSLPNLTEDDCIPRFCDGNDEQIKVWVDPGGNFICLHSDLENLQSSEIEDLEKSHKKVKSVRSITETGNIVNRQNIVNSQKSKTMAEPQSDTSTSVDAKCGDQENSVTDTVESQDVIDIAIPCDDELHDDINCLSSSTVKEDADCGKTNSRDRNLHKVSLDSGFEVGHGSSTSSCSTPTDMALRLSCDSSGSLPDVLITPSESEPSSPVPLEGLSNSLKNTTFRRRLAKTRGRKFPALTQDTKCNHSSKTLGGGERRSSLANLASLGLFKLHFNKQHNKKQTDEEVR